MERQVNTYQGLNKDTAYDSISASLYIDALDIRITTTSGESMGAWTNIKGNEQFFTIPGNGTFNGINWGSANPEIIGYTTIRNRIIVFVADNSGTKGWIYDVQYDTATRNILPGYPVLLYYNANLNFKKDWPIEALGRYETDCVQRIYWTDYNNWFRTINIEEPTLETLPLGQVDIFPDVQYTQPLLKAISGGSLATGLYQVSYRLKTIDGKETLIAPPGNMIHIVSDSENLTQSAQYNGDGTVINSGKAIEIAIDTTNYQDFYKIEFIVAYYETFSSTPLVLSVEELVVTPSSPIIFVYTGSEGSAFPIDLYEFTLKNYAFKTPKTITQKDSSLVIANIKGSSISIQDLLPTGETFDAKTRRYRRIGAAVNPPYSIDPNPADPSGNNLKNAFNELYNSDAHWDSDWHTNYQYRYKSDGYTLGGQGPNISYKFHLEPFSLDAEKAIAQGGFANISNVPDYALAHDLNDGYGTYTNTTFPNHASPFISGLLRGYKRGETYRFGIIFYTKKGEASFVEYIGDIKFPDISEKDQYANESGTRYWPICQPSTDNDRITIGYAMGIEFTIDFSSCPSIFNIINSYQIVRVERGETDIRRAMQGIMKTCFFNPIGDTVADFDLSAANYGNSKNVVHLMPHAKPWQNNPDFVVPHSFALIGDSESPVNNLPGSSLGNDYLIKSSYLAFLAPEISFNFQSYRNLTSLVNQPCLLMTGAYDQITFTSLDGTNSGVPLAGTGVYDNYTGESGSSTTLVYPAGGVDLSSENLALHAIDIRKKYSSSIPVNYNSIENIKRLVNTTVYGMIDSTTYQGPVTPLWTNSLQGGYHIRNYYAIDDNTDQDDTLNNPHSSSGGADYSELSKGGSALVALCDRFFLDPLTGSAVPTTAPTDFFRIKDNTTLPGGIYAMPQKPNPNPNPSVVNQYYPILDLLLPKKEVYGGFTSDALESNIFITASPVIDLANNNPKVFGGDIFLTMFTCQTSTVEINDSSFFELGSGNPKYYARSCPRTEVIPVETVMNLELAYGATYKTGVYYTVGTLVNNFTLRQETDNSRTDYGKTAELMYAYNPLYSRAIKDIGYVIRPVDERDCLVNDIRAYLSNVKINDEKIDSWTKFGINNYYDVDDYGPINKILNYKDTVYFIQDRGFGGYAINRAAITTTADGVPTQLGTGQGFGKHQYISKTHGSIHQWAVKATDTGIYFFDAINRKIFMFAASSYQSANTPLSELTGIHSWLQSLYDPIFYRKLDPIPGDNPILQKGVTVARDVINDEVIFTFLGLGAAITFMPGGTYQAGSIVVVNGVYYLITNTFTAPDDKVGAFAALLLNSELIPNDNPYNRTIVFDEIAKTFSSRYSATPKIWIENSDTLLSPNTLHPANIYVHNTGNWGEFYGVPVEAKITLVINPNADLNKVLRTLEFNSIVRDDNKVVDRTQTITAFEITTQYQSTGKIPYSAGRIMRKFDKWRVKIPRNQLSTSQQDRLRSTYFVLTLYFDNTYNKEIICNRLMSYYDVQIF